MKTYLTVLCDLDGINGLDIRPKLNEYSDSADRPNWLNNRCISIIEYDLKI